MSFDNRYSPLDRLLHRIAFRVRPAQEALADIEELLYRNRLAGVAPRAPVTISGLPRSGTTVLLDLLVGSGRFASHTYRDTPFVLCPMLWNRFARAFQVSDAPRERAHGDGLVVSLDSAEAFEEIIWKHFFPKHYLADRILPWGRGEANTDFDEFYSRHIRKIIALRSSEGPPDMRYVSKNNATIARLRAQPSALRAGVVVVPFREPLQHAASMLAQHRRFARLHAVDPFAAEYMSDLGHHEFGETHRPIDFDRWSGSAPDTNTLDYWLMYWMAAYRSVLGSLEENVLVLSYEALTRTPSRVLAWLGSSIGEDPGVFRDLAPGVRSPREHTVEKLLDPTLWEAAQAVYETLESKWSELFAVPSELTGNVV